MAPKAWDAPPQRCPSCDLDFPYLVECADGVERCWSCSRDHEKAEARRHEGALLLARLDVVLQGELRRAGLSPRERRCTMAGVTQQILDALSGAGIGRLLEGQTPKLGLGLSGPAGIGKTGLLAAVLQHAMRSRLERELPERGGQALEPWLLWLSWPEVVNRLRGPEGIAEAETLVARACAFEVLVLDDLGAERIRGEYSGDWAASQLDLIIDGRYRHDRRTLYTTTLEAGELVHRYGQRLFSRLCSENPLVQLPRSGDRRMREGR